MRQSRRGKLESREEKSKRTLYFQEAPGRTSRKQMAGYRMRDGTTKKAATRETQGFGHTSRIKRSFQHRKRQPLGACAQLKRQAGDAREVSFWPKPESSKLQVWCSRALIRTFCGWSRARASGSVPSLLLSERVKQRTSLVSPEVSLTLSITIIRAR
jgi:hypothetical protein